MQNTHYLPLCFHDHRCCSKPNYFAFRYESKANRRVSMMVGYDYLTCICDRILTRRRLLHPAVARQASRRQTRRPPTSQRRQRPAACAFCKSPRGVTPAGPRQLRPEPVRPTTPLAPTKRTPFHKLPSRSADENQRLRSSLRSSPIINQAKLTQTISLVLMAEGTWKSANKANAERCLAVKFR